MVNMEDKNSFLGSIYNDFFGPGSLRQAHLPNEYIDIKELEEYEKIIYEFLQNV